MVSRTRTRSRNRTQQPPVKPGGLTVFLLALAIFLSIRYALARFMHIPIPLMFGLWLALLLGAVTKRYPMPPSKSATPSERKVASYRRWKDVLAGLKPNRDDWTAYRRVAFWMGPVLGLLMSGDAPWWCAVISMLFGFMTAMGVTHWRDRMLDRRHPCHGVSLPVFWRHAGLLRNNIAALVPIGLFAVCAAVAARGRLPWTMAMAAPLLAYLLLVWLLARQPQQKRWRRLIDMQRLMDQWTATSALKKAYPDAYVTQCDQIDGGETPLLVIRMRLQDEEGNPFSNAMAYKLGVQALMPLAAQAGYRFVVLLGARAKGGGFEHDSTALRLILGKDDKALPDASKPGIDDKLATLLGDIAYAQAAIPWGKRAPLTTAHQVSAAPDQANAWLFELHQPPEGGNTLDRIGIDWLPNPDYTPGKWLHLPMFADLANQFHLAADESTPLTDTGNKWRQRGIVTNARPFDDYVRRCREFRRDTDGFERLFKGTKLETPTLEYDNIRTLTADGWTVTATRMANTGTTSASDYARIELDGFDPQAAYVGVNEDKGTPVLIKTFGEHIPDRIDKLTGATLAYRVYAQTLVFQALVSVMPAKAQVHIDSISQEGKDCALWRIRLHVDGGGTMADIRKRTANIIAAVGAQHAYLDWRTPDSGIIWLTGDNPPLDVADIHKWKRRSMQKELIQIALSNAWGVAGVYDSEGRNPTVTRLGALKHNDHVLLAGFEVPGGISVERPKNNLDKFLSEADYVYGRMLPRGDEHGARGFDMLLAKQSPFPLMVNADWEAVKKSDTRTFLMGVDDLGDTVTLTLKSTPHLVVCGKTGTGKSSALMTVVAEAMLRGGQIILIDPSKGCVDFTQWAKPHALAYVGVNEMRQTEAAIAWAEHEMHERVRICDEYGVSNIYDLDPGQVAETDRSHLTPLFIVFDEFNSYLQKAGRETRNPNHDVKLTNDNAKISATNTSISRTMSGMGAIAVQGRTSAIHLFLGAQRLSISDLEPYGGKAFYKSLGRVLLGSDSAAGVISQMNVSEANRLQKQLKGAGGLIPQGRGMYESVPGSLTAVQTWYSGSQQELAELFEDMPIPEPIDLAPFMPKDTETFGEFNAQSMREELAKAQADDKADAAALAELFGMDNADANLSAIEELNI